MSCCNGSCIEKRKLLGLFLIPPSEASWEFFFFFFASDFNCVCSYLAMTQYQRKVQNRWFNVKEEHSCLRFHLQVPLRGYGGFFFTPSQPSSVNTHPGERLKNPELSRHASVIHQLFPARNVNWDVSFPSGVGCWNWRYLAMKSRINMECNWARILLGCSWRHIHWKASQLFSINKWIVSFT